MPTATQQRHTLYRRSMNPEEAALFDHLVGVDDYDDLRREIALTRVIIHRCTESILTGNEWRVPLQVLPALLDKLIKMIKRMRPETVQVQITDDTEMRLQEMIAEAEAAQRLKRAGSHEASEPDAV